jgi:predicted GH43/DUF377 family glycosyl hydrolase/mannose-6-phosphate isomerase-like protein (cupin superfamily)
MINIKNEGIILETTGREFEHRAVLNPACIEADGSLHMFYRAIRDDLVSSVGYCRFEDGRVVERLDHPVVAPEHDYERAGIEDPRIVLFDGLYYLFYTAYDGKNARIAYATSADLKTFTKRGVISPSITYDEAEDIFRQSQVRDKYLFFEAYFKDVVGKDVLLWEKDAFIFPRRIGGKLAMIHRILPGMQVIYFDNFQQLADPQFWRDYLKDLNKYILLDSEFRFENRNVGGGCPPIETEDGWLLIYHAVEDRPRGRIYNAAAALLDRDDPLKVIGRLPEPLFSPEVGAEMYGDVNNVVFPTSAIVRDGRLFIYYGAADTRIMAKSLDLKELLRALKQDKSAPQPFSSVGYRQSVIKPWGEEIIYTQDDAKTTGKLLKVKAGSKWSLQYHEKKQETMALLSGSALLWIENESGVIEKIPMKPLHGYLVQPKQKHRVEALGEDSVILEASTPETGTTVRLDDDYGRPDETDEVRQNPNRV